MKPLKNYRVIITIAAICSYTNSSTCQDVTQELKIVNDFNESVATMKSALDRMSNQFYYYNEENKEVADELLKQILKLSETLRIHRNHFLLRVFGHLDSMQKQYVKEIISSELKDSDLLYTELVSLYNLTSHFNHIYSKVDTLALKSIKIQFTSKGYISDYNVMQLKYISTLANLSSDTLHENKLLRLVKELYDFTKAVDDEKKRNGLLVELYNLILPNSIGLIYSRSSVINSLYLIDETTIVKYSSDVGDSRFAYNYLMCCVFRKLTGYLDERYWDDKKFYESIDSIKEELISDNSIWKSHIKM